MKSYIAIFFLLVFCNANFLNSSSSEPATTLGLSWDLWVAVRRWDEQGVRRALQLGANPNSTNLTFCITPSQLPLDAAIRDRQYEIEGLLREYGAKTYQELYEDNLPQKEK